VRAVSSVGSGAYSTVQTFQTYSVPAKINATLTLTKAARLGRPALLASWRAPSSETSILSYQVQYKSTSSSTWKTKTTTSTSTYLESLSAGSIYQVQVRANSSIGLGPYSTLKTLQTYTVPAQIDTLGLNKSIRSGKPALRVSWTTPSSEASILSYQVRYRAVYRPSWTTKTSISTLNSTYLENLSPGTSYEIQVRAVSSVGSGAYSTVQKLPTYAVPSKITTLTLAKAARLGRPALQASWKAPSSETSILSYQVQYKSTSSSTWKTKTSTSTSTYLESLSAARTYQVQVRAVGSVGFGPFSTAKTVQTYTGI
jgi:hypothetical protein